MKKLTAGILTVMLGIVAANSADASIASKGYVDAQVKTSVSNATFETFKTENTANIADAKKAGTDANNALEAYKTTASDTFATQTALSDGLKTKQNTLTAADFVKDGTGNVVTGVTVGDDGKIKYTTASVATSAELGNLQTTVASHTTALDKLNGTAETDGSVAKSIADAVAKTTTAYEAADATTLQSAKDYADGLAGNYATAAQGAKADTAVQPTAIADMETKTNAAATYATKAALEGVDGKFANYTTTADMNTKLEAKADKTTIGTVPEGKTVVKMIEEAQTSATYDDTALKGRVDTIEKSAAYTSGITAAGVAQIETNKTGVADNKAKVEAVTKDLADNYTKTANLSDLAKATIPATCTDPNAANGCALILKNGVYSWEVVERDAAEK